MITSISIRGIQNHFKRSILAFILSFVFLPLPVFLGGSFLKEIFGRVQSIFAFGLSAGDLLLMAGMLVVLTLLIIVPLVGFTWGQVLAWTHKSYASKYTLLTYTCLSFAYLVVSIAVIRSVII